MRALFIWSLAMVALPVCLCSLQELKVAQCNQSSDLSSDLKCEKAIDGKTYQHYYNLSCSHVGPEAGWWVGSLAKKARIKQIRIYNRQYTSAESNEGAEGRLNDFAITVDGTSCASYKSNVSFSVKDFNCDVIGTDIKIKSNLPYLTLCEVQVFGESISVTESGKVLLFAIRAHSGKNALTEYDNDKSNDTVAEGSTIPDLFRSKLLNDLPNTLKLFRANRIVVEMLKAGKAVARAEFNVSDSTGLNSHNWFTPSRLVQTYPYWTGKTGFEDFGIKGHRYLSYARDFYIHRRHRRCYIDSGLMGIGESSNDGCSWVTNGGSPPVLFFAKQRGPYSSKLVVDYADQFIIYLKND